MKTTFLLVSLLAFSSSVFRLPGHAQAGFPATPYWGQGPDVPSEDPEEEPLQGCEGFGCDSTWGLECKNYGCLASTGEPLECFSTTIITGYGAGETCYCITSDTCCDLVFIPNFGFTTRGQCDQDTCTPSRCTLQYSGGTFSAACSG